MSVYAAGSSMLNRRLVARRGGSIVGLKGTQPANFRSRNQLKKNELLDDAQPPSRAR